MSCRSRITIHLIFALCVMLLVAPARSEVSAAVESKLDQAIDDVVSEHAVFQNCSATQKRLHEFIRKFWQEDVAEAEERLIEAGVTQAFLERFKTRTAYENMMRTGSRFAEIIELCNTNADWPDRVTNLIYKHLFWEIRDILN